MAKLQVMPEQAIIAGFKGAIDFYYWQGIPVARTWPRPPTGPRSTAVQATWPAWRLATQEWIQLSPFVQAAYNTLARGTGMVGRDLQIKGYISGLYGYPAP